MKNTRIAIDRMQVRLRGGSASAASALASVLGPKLIEALRSVRGLRSTDKVRVRQSGPADAGKIGAAVAEALRRS